MEQVSTTSPAKRPLPERITRARAAITRLEQREQQLGAIIERKKQPARRLLDKLLAEETSAVLADRDAENQTFNLLLDDESYKDDANFVPSGLDTARRNSFLMRNATIAEIKHNMEIHGGGMNYWGFRVTNPAEVTEAVQTKLNPYRAMGGFGKWWNRDTITALEQELQKMQDEIRIAPGKYAESKTAFEASKAALQKYPEQKSYDRLLQFEPAERFLPRSQQAALVSYDYLLETFTMHLPSTPTDPDFTQTVSFTLDSQDLPVFTELLGNSIKTDETGYSVADAQLNNNFEDLLIPFPLEVVVVDGEERVRIPKAIWGRFGGSANRD